MTAHALVTAAVTSASASGCTITVPETAASEAQAALVAWLRTEAVDAVMARQPWPDPYWLRVAALDLADTLEAET
jgi:hypothetical protein